ncbi:unnamed protein product [Heligmosomoides polygyrus]|uniref:Uncharacterized protein n=1 Tax=Heligmosomoides polygyrus TaxID=6339 RepID=A0A183GW55_HELPZ|nr:unnamed protein product [Heligmosomoides polygyrus]
MKTMFIETIQASDAPFSLKETKTSPKPTWPRTYDRAEQEETSGLGASTSVGDVVEKAKNSGSVTIYPTLPFLLP